ncbi:hypothetical protein [Streptomyces sp. NPDC021212]|uniref:hypothetical protein n=1 Tax=Streptomyces sp. NPDC021212 TaxID=3365118 RepID=UPI0037A420F2
MIGRETSGRIAAVGEGMTGWAVGDPVTAGWSSSRSTPAAAGGPEGVTMPADGVVPAARLITGAVPLTRVADAFEQLSAGRAMKVLVDCQEVAS